MRFTKYFRSLPACLPASLALTLSLSPLVHTHTQAHSLADWHTHTHGRTHAHKRKYARVNKNNKNLILAFPQVFHICSIFIDSMIILLLSCTHHTHFDLFPVAFARFSLLQLLLLPLLLPYSLALLSVFVAYSLFPCRFSHTIKTSNLKIFWLFLGMEILYICIYKCICIIVYLYIFVYLYFCIFCFYWLCVILLLRRDATAKD